MVLARWLGSLVVAAVVLTVGVDTARACGVWHLVDSQRKLEAVEHISTANFYTAGGRHLGRYWMVESPSGLRASDGKRVVADVRDGVLLYRGKRLGTVDGDRVTIGRKVFTVLLANPHDVHGMPAWDVTVKDGDTVIATGEGSSLCAGDLLDPMASDASPEDEVRRRVIYYLVWREQRGR